MFGFFKKKRIEDHLRAEKTIKIAGIRFRIRKISLIDYLEGSKSMIAIYDMYKTSNAIDEPSLKKVQDYYRDIILAGVISPKITRKKENEGVWIDDLLKDGGLSTEIAKAIINHTSGKKKI